MDQRSFVLILLLVVVFSLGGLVLWDVKTTNRFGDNEQKINWRWDDDWESQEMPEQPEQPDSPDSPDPEDLEDLEDLEEPERPDGQITASSYNDAIQQSGELGMPIFVYFEADWCSWCKKMKSETLSNSGVQEIMKNYILVQVDTDQDQETTRKFGVRALPSYVITNCNETKLKNGEGFKSASDFAPWLNNPDLYEQPKK